MSLANALRGPVKSIVGTFGRSAYLVHRSTGDFNPETGQRRRAFTRESVKVVVDESTREVADDGTSRIRGVLIAAKQTTSAPTTDDVLEFPETGEPNRVWQISEVRTIEEGGTAIAYQLDIRR